MRIVRCVTRTGFRVVRVRCIEWRPAGSSQILHKNVQCDIGEEKDRQECENCSKGCSWDCAKYTFHPPTCTHTHPSITLCSIFFSSDGFKWIFYIPLRRSIFNYEEMHHSKTITPKYHKTFFFAAQKHTRPSTSAYCFFTHTLKTHPWQVTNKNKTHIHTHTYTHRYKHTQHTQHTNTHTHTRKSVLLLISC